MNQKNNPSRFSAGFTGGDNPEKQLIHGLKQSFPGAASIDLIVSFLRESGARILLKELEELCPENIPIRILTGSYLGITEPSALYLLKQELKGRLDLRFYNDSSRSFHPKSFFIHYPDSNVIYVGSSNLSSSALGRGIEWNYRFSDQKNPEDYHFFYDEFEDLFHHHSIILDDEHLEQYARSWHKPRTSYDLDFIEQENKKSIHADGEQETEYRPRGAQIEALYSLEASRAEGANKALVCAATGIGKTYLAAFDSRPYNRVLFVAHRHEILDQAARSFENVRPGSSISFYEGNQKDASGDLVFSTVQTLGKDENLQRDFRKDSFDYIVVDEFHHAAASQYQRVLDYFEPKFLLGLTATPERMDGRSIYELCDYNVPYEIDLASGIQRGFLSPFHYYGIYDATDYSKVPRSQGTYQKRSLAQLYAKSPERNELILKNYRKHHPQRTLGFCATIEHAREMADFFNTQGIASAAVTSRPEPGDLTRDEAIQKLESGDLKAIFAVDIFNEGVDIPSIDLVMFLRPTESPTVFLQQLGRGLRKTENKPYLTVLDFIGNYQNAGRILRYLSSPNKSDQSSDLVARLPPAPLSCLVDLDVELIDLFEKMEQQKKPARKIIQAEFENIRVQLGHVPSRMEFYSEMSEETYELILKKPSLSPFKNYLGYLQSQHLLSPDEEKLMNGLGKDFIQYVETTNMSKVYKMPVLKAFIHDGSVRPAVDEEEVLDSWKEFFDEGLHYRDFPGNLTHEKYRKITDRTHLQKIKDRPVRFLLKSSNDLLEERPGYLLALNTELIKEADNPAFVAHLKDAIDYRAMDYFRRRFQNKKEKQEQGVLH